MTKLEVEVDRCRLTTKTLSTPYQANKGARDWSPLDESRIRDWRNEKFAEVQVCGSSWKGAGVMAIVQSLGIFIRRFPELQQRDLCLLRC
jgi:hypothetical protein